MAEYRPRGELQLDGSAHQSENCGAASGGTLADRARKGVKPATKYPWRTKRTPQADGTGWNFTRPTMSEAVTKFVNPPAAQFGLYAREIRAALKAMYNVSTGYAYGVDWGTLVAFLKAHRGCIIAVNYAKVQGTPYASAAFNGRHWMFVNERRYNAAKGRNETLVFDPLADHRRAGIQQGPRWWPDSVLRRAYEGTPTEIIYSNPTA